jgi:hypothetical protein
MKAALRENKGVTVSLKIDDKYHALLAAIPSVILYFALRSLMQEERAFAIAMTVFVFYALLVVKWDSRHDTRFWIAIVIFALVHVAILTIIKFPHYSGPSLIILPFALADAFAMWGVVSWLEKRW